MISVSLILYHNGYWHVTVLYIQVMEKWTWKEKPELTMLPNDNQILYVQNMNFKDESFLLRTNHALILILTDWMHTNYCKSMGKWFAFQNWWLPGIKMHILSHRNYKLFWVIFLFYRLCKLFLMTKRKKKDENGYFQIFNLK